MTNCETTLLAAPLQGYTDRAWREAHAAMFPGAATAYCAPFARTEHGEVRARDLRDTSMPSDSLVPQIIFRDTAEFDILVDSLASQGHRRIDLNLGCPFPPQTGRGRGAGALLRPDLMSEIAARVRSRSGISFSLKMRLGMDSPDQWQALLPAIESMPLAYVAIHPRTARQQYAGQLHTDAFARAAAAIPHPIVFNGDIATPADIDRALSMPRVCGVMAGRGLLGRPSLFAEWREGAEWSVERRLEALLELHRRVINARSARLCGPSQTLAAMKPYWHYAEAAIGRKAFKALHKASTLERYREALLLISAK